MFNSFSSFEKSNSFENKGSVLEYEYFSQINKSAYSQAVDEYQHPDLYKIENEEDAERVFWRKNADKKDYADSFKDDSYINFKDAMKIVERCQPGNPESPHAVFAGALRKEVSNILGEEYKVKFFTAVGSHLDTKHGIDAFIKVYNQEDQELTQVTLDISGREKGTSKANILIVVSQEERDYYDFDSENFDKDKFLSRIKTEALNIKEIIINNIHLKNKKDEKSSGKHPENDAFKKRRPRIKPTTAD